jgi:hypothetical protein
MTRAPRRLVQGVDSNPLGLILRPISWICRKPFVWVWRRVWYALIRFLGYIAPPRPARGDSKMTRNELVLAMLACAGGRSYTPVQIQKAIFLVCQQVPQIITAGPGFDFKPYDYGPFDADVYAIADTLQRAGGATVAPSPYGRWNTYAATDAGVTEGEQLLGQLAPEIREFLQKISEWVRGQSFSSLVKSIYDAYPAMRENSIFRG